MSLLKSNDSRERIKQIEFIIFIIYLLLMTIGFLAVKSATLNTPRESIVFKQLVFSSIGLILYFFMIFLPERTLKTLIPWLFYFFILLLGFVLVKGNVVYGARRWISVGPFSLQPSEFYKVIEILFLSYALSHKTNKSYYIVSLLILFSSLLIFKEPDLGTTLIVLSMWFIITFVSGKHEKLWKITFFSGLTISPFSLLFMKSYQIARITGFLNPNKNASGISYNTVQSMRAIGSGGLFGNGYMNGYMNLGNYVPEDHSDFIVSVIGEELGFIGIFTIILLYSLLIWRMYIGYKKSNDEFWKYFYILTAFLIFFHVFENIGMNMGIMPVTGIPLPFLTAGGSPMLSFSILLGIATKGLMINKNT